MILEIRKGNILDASEPMIMQQCNCVTVRSHGLSAQIVKRYPWANVYERRPARSSNCAQKFSIPGTYCIDVKADLSIIHLFAQVYPGKPGSYQRYYPKYYPDTSLSRVGYFQECINDLEGITNKIAVPWGIGCGLAGGNWDIYQSILEKSSLNFVLYKL